MSILRRCMPRLGGELKVFKLKGELSSVDAGGWRCPQEGWMKCNIDAGVKDSWGSATRVVC